MTLLTRIFGRRSLLEEVQAMRREQTYRHNIIMAGQEELAAQVTNLTGAVAALNTKTESLVATITKIGGETATLLQKIADLKAAADGASPALVEAIVALETSVGTLSTTVDNATGKAQVVDEQVPDPTEPAWV